MAYRIFFEGPTLVVVLSGTVEAADLHEIASEIIALEEGGTNTPNRLIDVRAIEDATVGYQDMARLADRSRARPLSAKIRSAILVGQPVQLGYARMFQILNDHPQITVRIFEDELAARVWLATGDPSE